MRSPSTALTGVITVLTTDPDPRGSPFLLVAALAIGFEVFCLADIARASQVRNLSKWKWALICLIQTPLAASSTSASAAPARRRRSPRRHAVMTDAVTGD